MAKESSKSEVSQQLRDVESQVVESENAEEREDKIKKLWEAIFTTVPYMQSGSGFCIHGECGLRRRNKIFARRVFKIFTLDRATW